MLTRILADNFRALVNFEFRPGKLCLLLGENGSGKSSLFEVLALLSDLVVRGKSAAELFRWTQTRWDARQVQRFELDVDGPEGTYRYALEISHPHDQFQVPTIQSEVVSFQSEILYRFADGSVYLHGDQGRASATFPHLSTNSFLANVDPRGSRLGWFKSFVEGIRILQPNPFQMETVSRQDSSILYRYCNNLPSFYSHLNDERPDVRGELESRLREVIPGFRSVVLKRVGPEKLFLASFGDQKGGASDNGPRVPGTQGVQGDQRG